MPVYEYICPNCGKRFEIFWKTTRSIPLNRRCPDCGTLSPKIYSPFNFQFSPYLKELREGNMLDY